MRLFSLLGFIVFSCSLQAQTFRIDGSWSDREAIDDVGMEMFFMDNLGNRRQRRAVTDAVRIPLGPQIDKSCIDQAKSYGFSEEQAISRFSTVLEETASNILRATKTASTGLLLFLIGTPPTHI